MKIYVAGKFEDHDECRKIMDSLEQAGHVITCDWTVHYFSDKKCPKERRLKEHCLDDINGVKNCDCLVFNALNERNYRGALVEMGIAIGLNKPVLVLGHGIDNCIFIY